MPLQRIDRRTFLRASGVAIALPFLEAMIPAGAAEAKKALAQQPRLVLIGQPLGMYAPNFFPQSTGRDYEPSRYLKNLEAYRDQLTVFSGMSHRYATGHFAEVGIFTGVAPEFIRDKDIKNGISLDQEAASHIGNQTRFPSPSSVAAMSHGTGAASASPRKAARRRPSANCSSPAPPMKRRANSSA